MIDSGDSDTEFYYHNDEDCAWDGGDCCPSTCVGDGCGTGDGYNCRDPDAVK